MSIHDNPDRQARVGYWDQPAEMRRGNEINTERLPL